MKQKICYKVTNESLRSCYERVGTIVQYKIGEFVLPVVPGSKLFVFDTLENAREYVGDSYAFLTIWECEVTNPKYIKRNILDAFEYDTVEGFWKKYNQKKNTYRLKGYSRYQSPKPGTIICDSVKLIKKMVA